MGWHPSRPLRRDPVPVSTERWTQHLVERNQQLERELALTRKRLYQQKARAELWRHRALKGATHGMARRQNLV